MWRKLDLEVLLVMIKGLLLHATKPMEDAVSESKETRMSTWSFLLMWYMN